MINNWNQACFAKMSVCGVQEESVIPCFLPSFSSPSPDPPPLPSPKPIFAQYLSFNWASSLQNKFSRFESLRWEKDSYPQYNHIDKPDWRKNKGYCENVFHSYSKRQDYSEQNRKNQGKPEISFLLFHLTFLFISWSTTFTISRNSSLVNIPFSISIRVRASCWTTWDMRSSSKETTCLGSSGVAILQSSLFP